MAPRRLALISAIGALAVGGAAAYSARVSAEASGAGDTTTESPCTDAPHNQVEFTRLTEADQAAVLRIVRTDPLVAAVTQPSDLAVRPAGTGSPSTPGMTFIPKAFALYGDGIGPVVMVNVRLTQPVTGTRRWRIFGQTLAGECDVNSATSAWTEVRDGRLARPSSELYIVVSRRLGRIIELSPLPGDAAWNGIPIGREPLPLAR